MKKFLSWLFWSRTKLNITKLPFLFISLNNLFPIFGVLFFNWEFFPILLFYCIEGVTAVTINGLKVSRFDIRKARKMYTPIWVAIGPFIVIAIMFVYLPLAFMVIVATSRIYLAFESIMDPYFIISTIILCFNILFLGIKDIQQSKINQSERNHELEGFLLMIKTFILVFGTFWIVLYNFYMPSLIIIAVVKTFIELRAFLRLEAVKQTPVEMSRSQFEKRNT